MPLYDETGKAIITPKTRSTYQVSKPKPKPTVTVKTKYLKPKKTTSKPKTTTKPVSKTTTARRRRLEQTQEFEDTGGPPATKEDIYPTYPGIYTKLSESKSNIEGAITGLRRPDTYYDPSKNAIVSGPLAMHPSFQHLTEEKIAELETTRGSIESQTLAVEKLEKEGYQIEKTTEGEYKFFKTAEQIEQEEVSKEKERLREYYYGDPGKKVVAWAHGVGTGLFGGDPFSIPSAIQMATGDKEGALETKARASLHLSKAWEAGPLPFALTIATGPLPMVGWSLLGGAAIGKASGFLTGYATQAIGPGAATAIKGIEIGAGVVMGGLAVHDVARTYEKEGLPQAIGKGALYGFMAGAAYGGYKSVDRTAMISKGEASYFKKHPDALKFVFGKKGELVSSDVKIDAFSSRGTPTETKKFMLTRKSIWKPAGKKRVGLIESWSKKANLESLQSIKDSKIHAWTEGHPALKKGPTVDYYGVGGVGMRGVDVKTSGVKPLVQSGETQFFSGQSGVKGSFFKRIFTTKIAKFSSAKDLTIKEAVGFGGIAKTVTKTVPTTATGVLGGSQAAPLFMGLGSFSGIGVPFTFPVSSYSKVKTAKSIVMDQPIQSIDKMDIEGLSGGKSKKQISGTTDARRRRLEQTQEFGDIGSTASKQETVVIPQVIQDFKLGITPYERQLIGKGELEQPVFIDEDITGKGRGVLLGPVFVSDIGQDTKRSGVTEPVFDFGQYQGIENIIGPIIVEDIKTEQRTETDQFLGLDEIITTPTKTVGIFDFSIGKGIKKTPGFPLPRGLGGSGGTDTGFGLLMPVSRKRKHRIGDILKELEKGFDF